MLYLNKNPGHKDWYWTTNLTLTSVVFELGRWSKDTKKWWYLTLTSVVFELVFSTIRYMDSSYLTLTSVVFE